MVRIECNLDTEFTITLEQVRDFAFTVTFDKESMKPLRMDEPAPLGTGSGPSGSRVLAGAVGHCLSSSLLFCLSKSRIPMKHVSAKVHATLARNEADRWRVQSMRVDLKAEPQNEQDRERMNRCLEIFEDFCLVTQSVRKGIDVQVDVQT